MTNRFLILFLVIYFLVCFALTGGTLLIIGGNAFPDYSVTVKVIRLSICAIYQAMMAYIFISQVYKYFRKFIDVTLLSKLAIYLALPWITLSVIILKSFQR